MSDERFVRARGGQLLALWIAGCGVGWLAGLSVSPVAAALLASIMGAVGGVVAGLSAGAAAAPRPVNAWPAAALVAGVALACSVGIMVRSHNVLGAQAQSSMTDPAAALSAKDPRALASLGVLYSSSSDDCRRLVASPDQSLAAALDTSRFRWAPRLAARVSDPRTLRAVVESLCEP